MTFIKYLLIFILILSIVHLIQITKKKEHFQKTSRGYKLFENVMNRDRLWRKGLMAGYERSPEDTKSCAVKNESGRWEYGKGIVQCPGQCKKIAEALGSAVAKWNPNSKFTNTGPPGCVMIFTGKGAQRKDPPYDVVFNSTKKDYRNSDGKIPKEAQCSNEKICLCGGKYAGKPSEEDIKRFLFKKTGEPDIKHFSNELQCRLVAEELCLTYKGVITGNELNYRNLGVSKLISKLNELKSYPKGCFYNKKEDAVYFNKSHDKIKSLSRMIRKEINLDNKCSEKFQCISYEKKYFDNLGLNMDLKCVFD